jgi:hypothetical protein
MNRRYSPGLRDGDERGPSRGRAREGARPPLTGIIWFITEYWDHFGVELISTAPSYIAV